MYRKFNQLADWLANVAKELTASYDLTTILDSRCPNLLPFSGPPFASKAINAQILDSGQYVDSIAYVGDTSEGSMGVLGQC